MKIGILTFHRAHNYGAVLQCFALKEFLKELGHEVYVIDYQPGYILRNYKILRLPYWFSKKIHKTLIKIFTEPFLLPSRVRKSRGFSHFVNGHLNLLPYRGSRYELDLVIVGSDQIWNPEITDNKYDPVFFGIGSQCRVVSYAASSKQVSLTESDKTVLISYLRNLESISVRESHLKKLLQPLINNDIKVVVDPSLLPSALCYERILPKCPIPRKYVLVYELIRHQYTRDFARRIASQLNCEVVEIASCIMLYNHSDNIVTTASPEDFLSLIKNATCVITTSFHGTAFSIKFQKNFYSIQQHSAADIRLSSLLDTIGLSERFVDPMSPIDYKPVDYKTANPLLDKYVEYSKAYLREALKSK